MPAAYVVRGRAERLAAWLPRWRIGQQLATWSKPPEPANRVGRAPNIAPSLPCTGLEWAGWCPDMGGNPAARGRHSALPSRPRGRAGGVWSAFLFVDRAVLGTGGLAEGSLQPALNLPSGWIDLHSNAPSAMQVVESGTES